MIIFFFRFRVVINASKYWVEFEGYRHLIVKSRETNFLSHFLTPTSKRQFFISTISFSLLTCEPFAFNIKFHSRVFVYIFIPSAKRKLKIFLRFLFCRQPAALIQYPKWNAIKIRFALIKKMF